MFNVNLNINGGLTKGEKLIVTL